MRLLLRGRPPIVVDVGSAGEDDDEYEGDYPQENHDACDSGYYVKGCAFVHHEYSAIEGDDAELDEAIANHHYKLNGEFELHLFQPFVRIIIVSLRTFPTSAEIGRT